MRRLGTRELTAGVAALALLVVAVGIAGYLHFSRSPSVATATRSEPGALGSRHAGSPSPVAQAPAAINGPRLLIPRINVNAKIENVGVDANGNMGTPTSPWTVGWYDRGTKPGDAGDAVFDGHLDWWTTGPAVFWNLGKLHVGDQVVVIAADGKKMTFAVDSANVYSYTAHPAGLFATSGPPEISLITCTGQWDAAHSNYLQRLVVNAHLVNVA